jgi:anti-sigma regulatory factor (Ser/Thr protein kinase)
MMIRMTLSLPAEAAHVSLCRGLSQTLLNEMGVVSEDVETVELIVGEICANAVKHAYTYPGERYEVQLDFAPDQALVTVRDHGKGADPRLFYRDPLEMREGGRGILLVQALADRFDYIVEDGTTINAAVKLRYQSPELADRAARMDGDGIRMTMDPNGSPPAS